MNVKAALIIVCLICVLPRGVASAVEQPLEEEIALFKAEQEDQVVIAATKYKQLVARPRPP